MVEITKRASLVGCMPGDVVKVRVYFFQESLLSRLMVPDANTVLPSLLSIDTVIGPGVLFS